MFKNWKDWNNRLPFAPERCELDRYYDDFVNQQCALQKIEDILREVPHRYRDMYWYRQYGVCQHKINSIDQILAEIDSFTCLERRLNNTFCDEKE